MLFYLNSFPLFVRPLRSAFVSTRSSVHSHRSSLSPDCCSDELDPLRTVSVCERDFFGGKKIDHFFNFEKKINFSFELGFVGTNGRKGHKSLKGWSLKRLISFNNAK